MAQLTLTLLPSPPKTCKNPRQHIIEHTFDRQTPDLAAKILPHNVALEGCFRLTARPKYFLAAPHAPVHSGHIIRTLLAIFEKHLSGPGSSNLLLAKMLHINPNNPHIAQGSSGKCGKAMESSDSSIVSFFSFQSCFKHFLPTPGPCCPFRVASLDHPKPHMKL